jgi:hypothetical protein
VLFERAMKSAVATRVVKQQLMSPEDVVRVRINIVVLFVSFFHVLFQVNTRWQSSHQASDGASGILLYARVEGA